MDFGSALQHLRMGAQVRRQKWAGMFIYLVAASEFEVNRPPLLGIYPPGAKVRYRAHIDYRAFDGSVGVYDIKQDDVLADDWEFVPGPYADDADPWDIDAAPGHEFGVEHHEHFDHPDDLEGTVAGDHTHDDHVDHGGTPHDDNAADLAARKFPGPNGNVAVHPAIHDDLEDLGGHKL